MKHKQTSKIELTSVNVPPLLVILGVYSKFHFKNKIFTNLALRFLLTVVSYFSLNISSFIISSGGCRYVIGIRPDDILYSPLPQYHTVTGMLAMSATMRYGVSMVMRHKFSATNYWKDCKHYDVTVSLN